MFMFYQWCTESSFFKVLARHEAECSRPRWECKKLPQGVSRQGNCNWSWWPLIMCYQIPRVNGSCSSDELQMPLYGWPYQSKIIYIIFINNNIYY